MNKNIQSVSFFGSSTSTPGSPTYEAAYKIARLVAESGRRVVNGGGPGVMLASTLGARSVNGKTTVVYYKPELATEFEGSVTKNTGDKEFEEENYVLRTKKLLELSDAFIIFKGGTGTLSELAMAWGISRLYLGHHKPIILYGTFWKSIMNEFHKHLKIRKVESALYTIVKTPKEAIETLEMYEERIGKVNHEHVNCTGSECALFL